MKTEHLEDLKDNELQKFFEHAEQEAERLECTVDYYIAEFL